MKAHASPHRVIRTSGARKEERLRETLMEHFFIRVWDDLVGRTIGPMHFRLILQPVMAGILGIRAGLRDARKNKSSYSNHRCNLLRERGKEIASVFVFALILDVIYQLIAFTRSIRAKQCSWPLCWQSPRIC
jgi:hypothetical protein